MDYYEELGLRPNATVEEIRQAYKLLARLVHPDPHTDPMVRAMGERQMKRLNDILATLGDVQKRRDYDRSLAPLPLPVPEVSTMPAPGEPGHWRRPLKVARTRESWSSRLPEWAQTGVRQWFWISLALVLLLVGVWYVGEGRTTSSAASVGAGRAEGASIAPPPAPQPVQPLPQPVPPPQTGRPAAVVPVSPSSPVPASLPRSTSTNSKTALPLRPPAPEPVRDGGPADLPASHPPSDGDRVASSPALSAAPAPVPAAQTFAGSWLHMPDDKPAPGAYPATYVELILGQSQGRISGTYRAKYVVPDRAVSPEVDFRIDGTVPAGDTAKLTWISPDGAEGEVEMVLHGADLLHLTWWTTRQGRRAALASGTARLLRQRTR